MGGTNEAGGKPADEKGMSLGVKLAVAGALGIGLLATGYVAKRQGRRLVGDTLKGVRRTPLEYEVLEALDEEKRLGRRRISVREVGEGRVELTGTVASDEERREAVRVASGTRGVREVEDALEVEGG